MDCIFCSIANSGGKFVYEDGKCVAILDKFPVSRGHLLIIPKEHAIDFTEVSDGTAGVLGVVIKKMAKKIDAALKPDGIKVVSNIREAAGQGVFHLHIHLIPVYGKSNDPYAAEVGVQRRTKSKDEMVVSMQKELSEKEAAELIKLLK